MIDDLIREQILSKYIPVMAGKGDDHEVYRWLFTQATSSVLKKRPLGYDAFVKIKDVGPHDMLEITHEIESQPDNWLVDTGRQSDGGVQRDTQSVFLRGGTAEHDAATWRDNQDVENKRLYGCYPKTTKFLHQFAESMDGTLSRALIVRLSPHHQVHKHYDIGLYYAMRDRYHLVVDSDGSRMQVRDEFSMWKKGELWWFHNKLYHEAHNDSDKWRTHLIFDVLPRDNFEMTRMIREYTYRDVYKISEEKIRDTSLIA